MASIISAGTTSGTALNMAGDTSGVLQLATNGSTTAVTVDTSQNVGIGTTSPSKKLHVYRNDTGQDAQIQIEQAGSGSPTLGFLETGVYAWLIGQYGADNSFRIAASGADLNTSPRLTIDTSGNLQFNSGYGSVATAYGCRAWVTYNGSTGAVIASGGVSSVTKLGPGDWQINFSITFPDANYAIAGFVKPTSGQSNYTLNRTVQGRHDTAPTTTQCRLSTVTTTAGQEDNENTRVIFIR
jgi:hypothetical protein